MTIHHDKMAYGRFAPLREDFSEERLEVWRSCFRMAPRKRRRTPQTNAPRPNRIAKIRMTTSTNKKTAGRPVWGAPPCVYPYTIRSANCIAVPFVCAPQSACLSARRADFAVKHCLSAHRADFAVKHCLSARRADFAVSADFAVNRRFAAPFRERLFGRLCICRALSRAAFCALHCSSVCACCLSSGKSFLII